VAEFGGVNYVATVNAHPRVALLIETSGGYGRNVLAGVSQYSRVNGPWSFYVLPRGHEQSLPDMKVWRGTGIIARIETKKIADAIAAAQLPVIGLDIAPDLLSDLRRRVWLSEVHSDPKLTAKLAADHLIERGFRSFAFVGVRDRIWSQEREQAFTQHLAGKGFPCSVFHLSEPLRAARYGLDQKQLGEWLKHLPRPTGLMSCNDDCCREVLDTAMIVGVNVPDDLGVIGVDDDEVLCNLCNPPLSSVIPNARRAGYEAAALLHRMMSGDRPPPQTILVEPLGVATRQSTDVVAVNDRSVAAAVRFIREQACSGITMDDVLQAVPMSRTLLERRFKKLLGHTPHEHILRVKIERVKALLTSTDLTVAQIADRTGFEHVEYLSVSFKRTTGESPSHFRARLSG
jgi:LacI family transcriptional regulator